MNEFGYFLSVSNIILNRIRYYSNLINIETASDVVLKDVRTSATARFCEKPY